MLYLGIDGGGTGCRAALADAQGRILGQGQGGPANINSDPQGAVASILAATGAAMAQAGITAGPVAGIAAGLVPRPGPGFAEVAAVLGLAGGGMEQAARALEAALPFGRCRVVNDAVTGARGALGPEDGILVAVGTGSVLAVQRGGVLHQYGGRGFVLGDEGSGAVLGRTLLARALRAADGFEADTPLLAAIRAELGGIEGVIAFATAATPAGFAALAPRLDGTDDPAARAIRDAAVAQMSAAIAVLQAGLRLPVTCIGGLGPFYARALAADWPVRPARGTGVDGALAMARELAP